MRNRLRLLLAAIVASSLLVTAAFLWRAGSGDPPPIARASPTPSARQLTVAQVYATLAPSVVSIRTGSGSGTGVVINAAGAVLTAFHVVEGADSIEVDFADGTKSPAEVAAADPANDIALLVAGQLPAVVMPAVLGGSRLAVGDGVVAIGNQLGLSDTTTSGVVSGLGRTAGRKGGGGELNGLIQFDAAVNPGSSGGPLVNTRAEVVGIVVALANPTNAGTFIGIGFAVPIGTAVGAGGDRRPQL